MKITIDKYGRKLYKFSHSVCQGGYLFGNNVLEDEIQDKNKLKSKLKEISNELELIDITIKVYDETFFVFFLMKPSISPQMIINKIKEVINDFGKFDREYLWTTVYDLQEKYVREDLSKLGFEYDNG